jgi:hypothetical protein
LAAFISTGAPPNVELYWAVLIWRTAGYITNQYAMLFLLLVGLMIFGIVVVIIATSIRKAGSRDSQWRAVGVASGDANVRSVWIC